MNAMEVIIIKITVYGKFEYREVSYGNGNYLYSKKGFTILL
jgi:nitrous oxidase accessory protein NosD